MTERSAEGVAGAESVDDLDLDRRHFNAIARRLGEYAVRPHLDDDEFLTELQETIGRYVGVLAIDSDLDFAYIAHGDGRERQGVTSGGSGIIS